MIAAVDVYYNDANHTAHAACIVQDGWDDASKGRVYTANLQNVAAYEPGAFYRRELPCLLEVLSMAEIMETLSIVIVDGYVDLPDGPGLGRHLYDTLHSKVIVIGIAKRPFRDAESVDILRGVSHTPLHVTAAGMSEFEAARRILELPGPNRIPTLLQRVDALSRKTSSSS